MPRPTPPMKPMPLSKRDARFGWILFFVGLVPAVVYALYFR